MAQFLPFLKDLSLAEMMCEVHPASLVCAKCVLASAHGQAGLYADLILFRPQQLGDTVY